MKSITRKWLMAGIVGLVAGGLIAAAGCDQLGIGGPASPTPEPFETAQSALARITDPAAPAADLAALTQGNTEFACDLYQQARAANGAGDIFFSPYSVSIALAMTYAGARGETETQMADTLKFGLPQEQLHPAFNALDLAVTAGTSPAAGAEEDSLRLNIVNRLWGQTGFAFRTEFLNVLAENYGAGMALLDFVAAAEPSRVIINDWVADQTENRIEDLIAPGLITSGTRLVLTNAIYFLAHWASQFEASATYDQPFHLLDGAPVDVPMMHQTYGYRYAAGANYQAIELPYQGEDFAMVVLLPAAGAFEQFDAALNAEILQGAVAALDRQGQVALTMPKFTMEWSASLSAMLIAMGMPTAFGGEADFSGMTAEESLAIGEVVHKAYVRVDETGTEAAAATGVVMVGTAAPLEPVVVTIDRPFVFLIRHVDTGAVLFLGRVLDPR